MCTMFEKATRGMLRCGLAATMVLGAGGIARADVITLTDGNSSAIVNLDPDNPSYYRTGMVNWTVDGVNKLYLQWFGIRYEDSDIGAGNPLHQGAIDSNGASLGVTPTVTTIGSNGLRLDYTGPYIGVSIQYTLTGDAPDSGKSKIDEDITITNLMARDLMGDHDLHFFQYSDFDLCGLGSHDSVTIGYGGASQSSTCDGIVSETVLNPSAGNQEWPTETGHGFQAGLPQDVVFNALGGFDLDNSNLSAGNNDAAWAFEWNIPFTAAGGPFDSFTIHKEKSLAPVPEPMSLVLLGAGLVGVGRVVRRRRAETVVA